jgi:hypothetical protein
MDCIEKEIHFDEEMCYVLNKCCSINGYAYRMGYINTASINDSIECQTIYDRRINLPKGYYAEIKVECGIFENPNEEKCWTDVTLFAPDGTELEYSEPNNKFTGIYRIETKGKNYIFRIFSKKEKCTV